MDYGLTQSMIKNKWYNHYNLKVGQSLEIHEKMWEWDNQRVWKFKCLVIAINKPKNHDGSFTEIWESSGIKIEKTYPLSFTRFDKIILLDESKVRKSKLYYQKTKVGKDARMKSLITKEDRGIEITPVVSEIVEEVTPDVVEETNTTTTPEITPQHNEVETSEIQDTSTEQISETISTEESTPTEDNTEESNIDSEKSTS